MRGAIFHEQRRQEIETRRGRCPEPDPADGPRAHFMHPLAGAVHGRQNPPRFLEHHLAGNSQRHASGCAVQQLRADHGFELRDLV